jgi:hypothetical protein
MHTIRASRAVTVAALAVVLSGASLAAQGQGATSFGPTESPVPAPTYTLDLPTGGQATFSIVEFHPPRGGRLRVGEGAFIRVRLTAPGGQYFLGRAAEAWDGKRSIPTSFLLGVGVQGHPVCGNAGAPLASSLFVVGHDSSVSTPYPQPRDPDVPSVRMKFWLMGFDVCPGLGNVAVADLKALISGPPSLEIVERVDWKRPR